MDFRDLDRMGDTDESILDEPYRPFYNIFASKPVLVKQYDARLAFEAVALMQSQR